MYQIFICGCFIGFICGYIYRWRGVPFLGKWGIPFVGQARKYNIGIYTGSSLKALSEPVGVQNPIFTMEDITDISAETLADPFLFRNGDEWHMFMEVKNRARNLGEIGYAISKDGLLWSYQSIVLREDFHLSYPFVFEYGGEIWMIPETSAKCCVRLYRAVNFPRLWKFEKLLLEGYSYTDASVFQQDGSWWMFVSRNRSEDLLLYFADDLKGPWQLHPKSPILYAKPDMARCAGRPTRLNGRLLRFAQNCEIEYGRAVRVFEVQRLSKIDFQEIEMDESPILYQSGQGWNANGMHHIDIHELSDGSYLAAVDGWQMVFDYGLRY
jgi:hypothetical protein